MPDSPPPPAGDDDLRLQITQAAVSPMDGAETVQLQLNTNRGVIHALMDVAEGQPGAVVYCGGAGGGPHAVLGPGDQVYARLASTLAGKGVSSLRLNYREPGELMECVLDVLAGCSFLKGIGADRVVLVGNSFGGAVVINAGQLAPIVAAVASLSPQLHGTMQVEQLGKPLLLIHGDNDTILRHAASEDIYDRALEPKRLVIFPGAGHGLRECAQQLFDELEPYLLQHAGAPLADGPTASPGSA